MKKMNETHAHRIDRGLPEGRAKWAQRVKRPQSESHRGLVSSTGRAASNAVLRI